MVASLIKTFMRFIEKFGCAKIIELIKTGFREKQGLSKNYFANEKRRAGYQCGLQFA